MAATAGGPAEGVQPDPVGNQSPASPTTKVEETASKRPENSNFKQQRLPAWQPIMSPKPVITCFLVTGTLFLIIGILIVVASDSVVEIDVRYDHKKACPVDERREYVDGNGTMWACDMLHVEFTVPKAMEAPVFLYYKLENFYQNHRLYAKSVSDVQLSGGTPTSTPTDCRPMAEIGEMVNLFQSTWNSTVHYGLDGSKVDLRNVMYNPCGLIAWSMFNDTISLYKKQSSATSTGAATTPICQGGAFDEVGNIIPTYGAQQCEKKGIAWPSDPGVRFTSPAEGGATTLTYRGFPMPAQYTGKVADTVAPWNYHASNGWYIGEEGHKIPNPADEDFMVWMRLASLSSFRKLYRRITSDLQPGLYEMQIAQRFDVRQFGGKKSFVISTSSWIGGKNYFLAGMYIAVGSVCLILGAAFFAKYRTTPRAGRVI